MGASEGGVGAGGFRKGVNGVWGSEVCEGRGAGRNSKGMWLCWVGVVMEAGGTSKGEGRECGGERGGAWRRSAAAATARVKGLGGGGVGGVWACVRAFVTQGPQRYWGGPTCRPESLQGRQEEHIRRPHSRHEIPLLSHPKEPLQPSHRAGRGVVGRALGRSLMLK
jgi:hypothetical protein